MENEVCRILYVDDEAAYCNLFRRSMEDDDRFAVKTCCSGEEALSLLQEFPAEIVFTDLLMPKMNGLTLLDEIHHRYPDIFVLMLTGVDSADKAVKAMKAGAYDYILKPLDMEMLRWQLEKILHHTQLLKESKTLQSDDLCFENMIGRDKALLDIFDKIQLVAKTEATVFISGESGTGKELIAEAIHKGSNRKDNPFIKVNCAALTDTLINSELFGHEKGAFTGATQKKQGLFEKASGGTIFLDEIGDIPIQTQVALLRVLEQGSFQRVGGTETVQVDTRVICATNKNLMTAIAEKAFREDLYYRINVVSLTAPPLRARKSDIPMLTHYFVTLHSQKNGKQPLTISSSAMSILCDYNWPGNIRQLSNVIERAVVFCKAGQIKPEHLPHEITKPEGHDMEIILSTPNIASAEEQLIRTTLHESNWHLTKSAQALGISRGTLYSKMSRYGITKQ